MADGLVGYDSSVKQGDLPARKGAAYLVIGSMGRAWISPLPLDLPNWGFGYAFLGNHLDAILYSTVEPEGMWGSAVNIAMAKVASQGYKVESSFKARAANIQKALGFANGGAGWRNLMQLVVRDYLTTDNGAFIEVVRAGRKPTDRVVQFNYLDSQRCIRTGIPEQPVIYCDLSGNEHLLNWWQVIALADMPDEKRRGAGICAAHRAYSKIAYIAALERYVMEESTGRNPSKVHFVTGVLQGQLEEALEFAQQSATAKGLHNYMGSVVIPVYGQVEGGISGYEVQLRGLPSGFNIEEERTDARRVMAAAIGLDIQDLMPGEVGGALGSSTQSQVLDDKQRGRLPAQFVAQLIESINMQLDDASTVELVDKDYRDQLQQAEVDQARATLVKTMTESGTIDAMQGRQLLVDWGVLPREFIAADLTPNESLEDDEKPLTAEAEQAAIAAQALQQQPAAPVATKEVDPLALLTDEETIERARAMMRELEGAV